MGAINAFKVLHLDDDEVQLEYAKLFLEEDKEIKITSTNSPSKALELLLIGDYDCIVSDYKMPEMDGIAFAKKVRETSDIPFILYTGQGSEEVAEQAFAAGVDDYIRKENHPAHYRVLAKRIASVVERKRMEAKAYALERSTREKLEALHRHATILVNLTTLEEVAECSFDIIEKVMGFTLGAFLVVQGGELVSIRNWGSPTLDRAISLSGKGITAKAAREKKSVLARDVRSDPDYVRGTTDSMSELAVPIILGKEAVAVINFESLELGAFDEMDRKLLEILSEHVASTIQRIRLLESLRRYTANLEALQRHATSLAKIDTVEEVAKYSFEIMEKLLGFTEGSFGVVEEGYLKFIYARPIPVEQLQRMPLSGRGITVRVVKTGESQMIPDVRLDPDFVNQLESMNPLSELAVPVKLDERVIAVINLERENLNAFSDEDQRIIEILGEQVASAISRIEQLKVIKASGETYQRLLDSSLDSVFLLSGTKIIYANTNAAKLIGYDDVSDLIGQDITITLPEDEKEGIRQMTLSRQRGEPQPDRYELRLLRPDGKTVETETAVSLIEYEGKPAVLSFTRDLTERKCFERQVIALHSHAASLSHATTMDEVYHSTLDAAESVMGFHVGSFLIAGGGNLVSIDNRGSPTFGKPILINGKGITAKAARERRSVLVTDVRSDPDFLLGTTDSLSELAVPVILDGETVAVLNFESLELNAFNEADQRLLETLALHVASAIYRIREMERMREQETAKSRELLDGANKLVSMVRHDLRNPLQTIQSASYLIRIRPDRAEEYTRRIDDSVEYAVKILDDLKVMMEPQQLNRLPVDLNELVKNSLEGSYIPSNVRLEVDYGAPVTVEVDSFKIRRVVDNLVKNAVEAMPDGGTLTLRVEAADGMALMTVRDTGGGITDEVAANLFTPFYTTKQTGTGLGLAICKQVVEAHGGRIEFESEVGKGTYFTVELPMTKRESQIALKKISN